MRLFILLLLLVCFQQAGFGQQAAPGATKDANVTISAPLPIPLLGLLNTLPQRPSFDDSLARRYYARNRVKTVTLLHLRPNGGAPDTIDYTELDHAGYPILTAKPDFKARSHYRYNRRHQLVNYIKEAEPHFPLVVETVFNPATKTTITRVGRTLTTLSLYQTGHASQRGRGSEYEAFLLAVPQLPPPLVSRVLLSTTIGSGDTIRHDVVGYRDEQVVKAESYYSIGRAPQPRENGTIVLPTAGRANHSLEGQYIPRQRYTYNAAGWLIRTQSLPTPPQLAEKPVTQTSNDGRSSMTIKESTDTLITTYQRNADGQLLREEYRGKLFAKPEQPVGSSVTTYDYLPNGLRHSKFANSDTRYEYRYTFY